jgi:hypothetical protein
MTLPAQLRAIADRIEAAETEHRTAVEELVGLTVDRVALTDGWPDEPIELPVSPAGAEPPGEVRGVVPTGPPASPAAPIEAPGQEGTESPPVATPPVPVAPVTTVHVPPESAHLYGIAVPKEVALGSNGASSDRLTCPDCERSFKRQGYASHRSRMHGDQISAKPTRKALWEQSHAPNVPYPGGDA